MKLTSNCTICDKPLTVVSEIKIGDEGYFRSYKCGHAFFTKDKAEAESGAFSQYSYKAAVNGKEAYEYQREGVRFIANSGWNCVVADPMGLGKTIQVMLAAREARNTDGTPKFKTSLFIAKAATIYQVMSEAKEWFDPTIWSCCIIPNTKAFIIPGFRMYIISMDTMSRFAKTPQGLSALQNLGIDLVIVDECHSFKNPESARSQALVAFLQGVSKSEVQREIKLVCNYCRESLRRASIGESAASAQVAKIGDPSWNAEWTEIATIKYDVRTNKEGVLSHRHVTQCPKCKSRVAVYQDRIILDEREQSKGLVMLSGTPIKNRAEEYFIPLNLLRPDLFTNLASFRRNWLEKDENGKWNRIKSWKLDAFRELTKDFIIRREKSVLQLPPFRRAFIKINIEDEGFKRAYNSALDSLQADVDLLEAQGKKMNFFDVQAHLFTLRRIVGMAKVPSAIEYVEDFLESVEDEKLAVGVQHDGVRDTLYNALTARGISCLKLSGEDNAERKASILKRFNSNPNIRVIIINMIAGGVGLNIQAANNTLILERQWNAADEEQFEGRFWRDGQKKPVLAEYMTAAGIPTEDYFTELVEYKRKTCGETLDGWSFAEDNDAVREMVYKSLHSRL